MKEMIRVLIVDDHAMVREGLRTFIHKQDGIDVVGSAKDGEQAVQMALELKPDVILMDIVMPGKDGIQAISEIMQKAPQTRILVVTSFSDNNKVFAAIKAGAIGYLLKDSSAEELIDAIHSVKQGIFSMQPSIAHKIINEISSPLAESSPLLKEALTERELAVLKLAAQGNSNREIGATLHISEWTVRTHISKVLRKLHLANRTQITLYALREGLVYLNDNPGDGNT
jgi:NarL family two-component system response regulator LiaR